MAKKTLRGATPLPAKLTLKPPKIDFKSGGEGSDVFFQFSGLSSLAENLLAIPKVYRDAAGYEMAEIAHEVIEDAKENYVPYRSGDLKDSGNADEYDPNIGASITKIAMWFGAPLSARAQEQGMQAVFAGDVSRVADPSTYALIQHEDLSYHHPIGGNKYLEKPFLKVQNEVAPRIAKAAGIAIGTQGGTTTLVDTSEMDSIISRIKSSPVSTGYPKFGKDYPGKK